MKTLHNNIITAITINFLFSAAIYAQKVKLPEHCLDSSIKSVQAKVDSNSKKMFTYYYQKITKHTDPSKPTFIIIPGGPGKSAMSNAQSTFLDEITAEETTNTELYWGLPIQSNVILTGPRSIDCNANNNLPVSSYSTKNIVQDLVALIKKEKLTNYIIVGRSYGSIVTTQLSYYIENNKTITNPRAVLLTGVCGHYLDINTQSADLQLVWGELYKNLSASVQKMFPPDIAAITDSEDFQFPLGIGAQTWLNMIQAELNIGFNYFTYEITLKSFLENLEQTITRANHTNKGNPHYRKLKQNLSFLKERVTYYSARKPSPNSILFETIASEIYIGQKKKNPVSQSQLWNSNNWQIKTIPVIYFHGSWDIITPISNALHHYKGQKVKKHKYFITAKKGGHDILTGLTNCKAAFWQSLSEHAFTTMITTVQACDPNFKVLK